MPPRKYLLDTNVITGKTLDVVNRLLKGEQYSCVVLCEVMAAADPKPFRAYVETWKRAEKEGKLLVPHADDWLAAARILYLLAQERKRNAGGRSPARRRRSRNCSRTF